MWGHSTGLRLGVTQWYHQELCLLNEIRAPPPQNIGQLISSTWGGGIITRQDQLPTYTKCNKYAKKVKAFGLRGKSARHRNSNWSIKILVYGNRYPATFICDNNEFWRGVNSVRWFRCQYILTTSVLQGVWIWPIILALREIFLTLPAALLGLPKMSQTHASSHRQILWRYA